MASIARLSRTISAVGHVHSALAVAGDTAHPTGAPFGITGLESALPSLYDGFVRSGKFGWDVVVQRFSTEPRRLMGLEPVGIADGEPASLVLFNPERTTTFTEEFMLSKSNNTPFLNREVQGMVELVVHGGDVLVDRVSGEGGGSVG